MNYILFFKDISLSDLALVGGKNASLGQMYQHLSAHVRIPNGFAVTVDAYRSFLKSVPVSPEHAEFHERFMQTPFSEDMAAEIGEAYARLSSEYQQENLSVAVRSSATAEDLPNASFAGQQDTFLHIQGNDSLLDAIKRCMLSLFTERAIAYRQEKGFDPSAIGISVGVQKMVNSDNASSGVMFTLETESGHRDFITINASYGLGQTIVGGMVNPDEFMVHKPTLVKGFRPLVKKVCGDKQIKAVYCSEKNTVDLLPVDTDDQIRFSLTDDQVFELASYGLCIEDYFSALSQKKGGTSWTPMDIEWAQDSYDHELYIVQARPETVHRNALHKKWSLYSLSAGHKPTPLVAGLSIGRKIASGKAKILTSPADAADFNDGDILVTSLTDPDWVPVMKRAAAIVTERGGRTCHAAIIARELGVPAVVGAVDALYLIKDGARITVDCSQASEGFVYEGEIPFAVKEVDVSCPRMPVDILINIANPDNACQASLLPVAGAGLVRLEFIIAQRIAIHPMAALFPEKVLDEGFKKRVALVSRRYGSLIAFYEQTLACDIGLIAAALYPRPVVVRLTDFKSNEYKDLCGGSVFEPEEENPMLGFRGAARYTHPLYAPAFTLECSALVSARERMGFDNIIIMVPFVRTVSEAQATLKTLAENGLERGKKGLRIYLMVEIPANVILLEAFAPYFDGFSIGSNDLTQLTLGIDRDSGIMKDAFNEHDPAVTFLIQQAITKAHAAGKHISICGQGPSDSAAFARWLIDAGIDALSLNVDAVLPFIESHKDISKG